MWEQTVGFSILAFCFLPLTIVFPRPLLKHRILTYPTGCFNKIQFRTPPPRAPPNLHSNHRRYCCCAYGGAECLLRRDDGRCASTKIVLHAPSLSIATIICVGVVDADPAGAAVEVGGNRSRTSNVQCCYYYAYHHPPRVPCS